MKKRFLTIVAAIAAAVAILPFSNFNLSISKAEPDTPQSASVISAEALKAPNFGDVQLVPLKAINSTFSSTKSAEKTYILNTHSGKFHDPDCKWVDEMNEENKKSYTGDVQDILDMGYVPCKVCNPASDSNSSSSTAKSNTTTKAVSSDASYVVNTNSGKFHKPSCQWVSKMSESNKQNYTGSRDDLVSMGYVPCKVCNP